MPTQSTHPAWLQQLDLSSAHLQAVHGILAVRSMARSAAAAASDPSQQKNGYTAALNAKVAQAFPSLQRHAYRAKYGKKPRHRGKNRYDQFIPYDATRVVFADMALGDDYVSASWLAEPAYEGSQRRQWIAAQGPMDHTAHAFLSMFLRPLTDMSQNSKTTPSAVVALTRCVEDDEQKCAQYWPHQVGQRIVVHHLVRKAANESKGTPRDDASEKPEWIQGPFPPITVTLVWSRPSSQEDSKAGKGWRHNRLKIETFDPTANRGEGAKIVRFVDLIEYKEWPDFGVPQSVSRFLRFVRFTLSKLPAAHGSVVVHCHAGIGRTGTFCAIVWLIGYLKVSINSDGTCEIPKDRLLALEQASLASPLGPLERVRIPRMPVKHSKENPTASAQPSSAGDRSSGHAASVPLPASRSPSCDSRSSRSSTRQYRVGSSIGSTSSSGSISYETHPFDPIMAFVDILRDQRPHMVQTMGQLRYIYKVGRSLWNQAAGLPEESLSSRPVSSS